MKTYNLAYSPEARNDLRNLAFIISENYKSPLTAVNYLRGIDKELKKLSRSAESHIIQTRSYFRQYGLNVRRLNYKKMTIIYTVVNNTVYIQRIIPASTIAGI